MIILLKRTICIKFCVFKVGPESVMKKDVKKIYHFRNFTYDSDVPNVNFEQVNAN